MHSFERWHGVTSQPSSGSGSQLPLLDWRPSVKPISAKSRQQQDSCEGIRASRHRQLMPREAGTMTAHKSLKRQPTAGEKAKLSSSKAEGWNKTVCEVYRSCQASTQDARGGDVLGPPENVACIGTWPSFPERPTRLDCNGLGLCVVVVRPLSASHGSTARSGHPAVDGALVLPWRVRGQVDGLTTKVVSAIVS
jgi:hypothetical protein